MKLALNRKLFILSTFALLIFSSLTITDVLANSEDDDTVDGVLTTQNFNNEAKVTDFDMREGDGTNDFTDSALDPFTNYTMQVTVLDPDTIRDLRSVELRFYYSNVTDSAVFETNFGDHESVLETGTDGSKFVLKWNNPAIDQNSTADANFSIVSSSGITLGAITWELIESGSDVPSTTTEFNRTTFTFQVNFKISKVATQTLGDAKWYVGAILEDGRSSLDNTLRNAQDPNTVYPALKEASTQVDIENSFDLSTDSTGFNMNFYGEIVKPQEVVSVAWDNVPAGVTFGGINASSAIEDITFISNGKYETRIKSSEDWEAIMTPALADVLFSGVSTSEWDAFATALSSEIPSLSLTGTVAADYLQNFKNLGLTFAQVNQVAIAASSTNNFWDNFMGPNDSLGILLPESSTGVNRTGAKIVTTSAAYANLANLSQFFAIAYKLVDETDTSITTIVEAQTTDYFLVGDDFRSIQEETSFNRDQTLEIGRTVDFDLYLALSAIFQNARYQGTITLKIVNQ